MSRRTCALVSAALAVLGCGIYSFARRSQSDLFSPVQRYIVAEKSYCIDTREFGGIMYVRLAHLEGTDIAQTSELLNDKFIEEGYLPERSSNNSAPLTDYVRRDHSSRSMGFCVISDAREHKLPGVIVANFRQATEWDIWWAGVRHPAHAVLDAKDISEGDGWF